MSRADPYQLPESIETPPVDLLFHCHSGLSQLVGEFFHQLQLVLWRKSFDLFFDFSKRACSWHAQSLSYYTIGKPQNLYQSHNVPQKDGVLLSKITCQLFLDCVAE